MNKEQFKVMAFAMTMSLTIFVFLFHLIPIVYGATATKPKLFRAIALMLFPLMMSSGYVGLRAKSKSYRELLVRGLLNGFVIAWVMSLLLLVD